MFPRRGKIDPDVLAAWKREQAELRQRVRREPLRTLPDLVAGADCAFLGDDILAAAVLWDRGAGAVVAEAVERRPADVPYLPGYLGFREAPAVLAALRKLPPFGALLCDGQGIAHPRRCGLAVHLGVKLDVPTVGVAKSRLVGTHGEPGTEPGDAVDLLDGDERIGTVLRTRRRTRPLYISIGHRVTDEDAVALVRACGVGYRLPEPTRRADAAVAAAKRRLA